MHLLLALPLPLLLALLVFALPLRIDLDPLNSDIYCRIYFKNTDHECRQALLAVFTHIYARGFRNISHVCNN